MTDNYDILNSSEFFTQNLKNQYEKDSLDKKFKTEFPYFNAYYTHAKLMLMTKRDMYVESFENIGITDIKYIVETMLNLMPISNLKLLNLDQNTLLEVNEKR